jgi:hypothetical protein
VVTERLFLWVAENGMGFGLLDVHIQVRNIADILRTRHFLEGVVSIEKTHLIDGVTPF